MNPSVFPWQIEQWERLLAARAANRFPHALLLAGPAGVGKRAFAQRLARTLLCQSESDCVPCGECAGCRQHAAETHPDHFWVGPPEEGKSIPVDTVRQAIERLALSGRGTKVALIDAADTMTTSAANSLLKTLEEPAGDAVLLLVSDRAGRLPATIRSRCQRVVFGIPAPSQALQWLCEQGVDPADIWLRRAGGAPLRAQTLAQSEDAVNVGAAGEELLTTLEQARVPAAATGERDRTQMAAQMTALIAVVQDLIMLSLMPERERLHRPDQRERMMPLAARLDARRLFDYLDGLYRSVPGASDSLRSDIQYQGLLADAAEIARDTARASQRGAR
ncbi:MAG: DNA polymerase III subunit delta' [Halofilum sp. (in: g-proteobacteria)]